jgi:leukotriene-A4 hydrolase
MTNSIELFIEFAAKIKVERESLSLEILKKIDLVTKIGSSNHPEVKVDWLATCVHLKFEEYLSKAEEFVTSIGRMKYLIPLYQALNASYPERARELLESKEDFYQEMAKMQIKKILGI